MLDCSPPRLWGAMLNQGAFQAGNFRRLDVDMPIKHTAPNF
jgi:hypothetical protein